MWYWTFQFCTIDYRYVPNFPYLENKAPRVVHGSGGSPVAPEPELELMHDF